MEIQLIVIGKTNTGYLQEGITEYLSRLKRYVPFKIVVLPDPKNVKNLSEAQRKEAEADLLLNYVESSDKMILLDEKGNEYTSMEFSAYISKSMATGKKRILFIVGGPYGFSNKVYQRCNDKISLSKMTFNHEMIRLIFTEQLYRAMTILRNEPYHHK